jgi:PBP1b-binding outer membrane lipoprotein LpoB
VSKIKKLWILSLVLTAMMLSGCKGEDAIAKCIAANIKSDTEGGKLNKVDTAAMAQADSMYRTSCIEGMSQKAY